MVPKLSLIVFRLSDITCSSVAKCHIVKLSLISSLIVVNLIISKFCAKQCK